MNEWLVEVLEGKASCVEGVVESGGGALPSYGAPNSL